MMSKEKTYNVTVCCINEDGQYEEKEMALPDNGAVFKFIPPKDCDAAKECDAAQKERDLKLLEDAAKPHECTIECRMASCAAKKGKDNE